MCRIHVVPCIYDNPQNPCMDCNGAKSNRQQHDEIVAMYLLLSWNRDNRVTQTGKTLLCGESA